jgi:hypothetical protein
VAWITKIHFRSKNEAVRKDGFLLSRLGNVKLEAARAGALRTPPGRHAAMLCFDAAENWISA